MYFVGSGFNFSRYRSLPPAIPCLLFSVFVVPLFDVVRCPTTIKLTSMVERVHSRFVKSYHHHFILDFHGTSQVSYCCSDLTYMTFFVIPQTLLAVLEFTITLENQVFYRGTLLWNCSSQTVIATTSFLSFKKLYYKYI